MHPPRAFPAVLAAAWFAAAAPRGLRSRLSNRPRAWEADSWEGLRAIQTPIVFFGPYSGQLPDTFPLTVASMRSNQDCCTFVALHSGDAYPTRDAELLAGIAPPPNFHWLHMNGTELERLFNRAVGVEVQSWHVIHEVPQLHHKWNDWRVFAPRLLKEHLSPSVEFWGYLEHDAVYGNVSRFLPHIRQFEVFTAADAGTDRVSAPFVLHRLGAATDSFIQRWLDEGCARDAEWKWCDEAIVTDCIQHPADTSGAPCAAPGLRSNFPVTERQFCNMDQDGMWAAWTSNGEALCEGQTVLGVHFHMHKKDAADAFRALDPRDVEELQSKGWGFKTSIAPDPECASCVSSTASFYAGAVADPTHLGWRTAANGALVPAILGPEPERRRREDI